MGENKDRFSVPTSINASGSLSSESRFLIQNTVIDQLTELPVMMQFLALTEERLGEECDTKHAVIYCDVDNFKFFNRKFGFQSGNDLLKYVADLLKEHFPKGIVSRFADDHFAVCCSMESLEELKGRVFKFQDALREYPYHMSIDINVGICEMEGEHTDVLAACDNARYACSYIKRNRNVFSAVFDPELKEKSDMENFVLEHFEEAMENRYIKVYYQPIIRSVTGQLCNWEALARWDDPERGMISPDSFIGTLEKYQLIHKLDEYIIRRACEHYRGSVLRHGSTVPVSVNLSRMDFELTDIFQVVNDACRRGGVPHSNIKIEITESALVNNPEYVKEAITKFRSNGFQVWLDDFGSGYSSFNVLKDYDFDLLKIDMKFLSGFDATQKSRRILMNIVKMAKEIGVQTLAEGIENRDQADFLRTIGCEMLQGYLYAKPEPVSICEQHILEAGITFEPVNENYYYTQIGKINFLSQTPFKTSVEEGAVIQPDDSIPLAVIEECRGVYKCLIANEIFRFKLAQFGIYSLDALEEKLMSGDWSRGKQFLAMAESSRISGREERMDFVYEARYCDIVIRYIVGNRESDKKSYMVILRSYSSHDLIEKGKQQEVVSRHMMAQYYRADLLAVDGKDVRGIYMRDANYIRSFTGDSVVDSIKQFARANIYMRDRERFIKFNDMDTFDERVEGTKGKYLVDVFRARDERGTYSWQWCQLLPAVIEGREWVVFTMKPASDNMEGILEEYIEREMANSEELNEGNPFNLVNIFENTIDVTPSCIYWKDLEGRIVGGNQQFIEFFNLDTIDDVLGKKSNEFEGILDEDVVLEEERRVVEFGETVMSMSQVVVRGDVRQLLITRKPLYFKGKVSGMVGCFLDITRRLAPMNPKDRIMITDFQTDM
ncbi:MAG: EAL domain-containing protein, partial [Eubacterium sp.]|nr:EAL domain-containing protein [Eubacterium sp.]